MSQNTFQDVYFQTLAMFNSIVGWFQSLAMCKTNGDSNQHVVEEDQWISQPRITENFRYLKPAEVNEINSQFEHMSSRSGLVFWSGIPRDWVQQWADEHNMCTLTSLMGPLMDVKSPRCARYRTGRKGHKGWKHYVKDASRIFAQHACKNGVVRVLTWPPSESDRIRPCSTWRTIEEPILKGHVGSDRALQINFVHPMVKGAEDFEYQVWPQDHSQEWIRAHGANVSKLNGAYKKLKRFHKTTAEDLQVIPSQGDNGILIRRCTNQRKGTKTQSKLDREVTVKQHEQCRIAEKRRNAQTSQQQEERRTAKELKKTTIAKEQEKSKTNQMDKNNNSTKKQEKSKTDNKQKNNNSTKKQEKTKPAKMCKNNSSTKKQEVTNIGNKQKKNSGTKKQK